MQKLVRCFGLSSLLAVASSPAVAQDADVKTAANSAKLGLEFRAELNRDDHGLEKVSGETPDATMALQLQTLKLKLGGNLNSDTEYKIRFNFLSTKPVDYAYGTHNMGPVAFSIGKMKVMQGGWDNMDNGFKDHVQGPYASNLAFSKYEDMIAFSMKAAGKATLQLVNDVSGDDAEWNDGQHVLDDFAEVRTRHH